MTIKDARKWIAIYFLLTTAATGAFLLLFSGSIILPLGSEDASASFQILVPVLVGQVTVIFQWLALANEAAPENNLPSPVASWAIKLPPILAFAIILTAAFTLALANRADVNLSTSPGTFKNALTFSVTLLNASTIFLVARLFPHKDSQSSNIDRQ